MIENTPLKKSNILSLFIFLNPWKIKAYLSQEYPEMEEQIQRLN